MGLCSSARKGLPDRELLARARDVRRGRVAPRSLHRERPARYCPAREADGVHLGQDDLSVRCAPHRRPRPAGRVSTHSIEQVRSAVLDGADYLGVGPCSHRQPRRSITSPGWSSFGPRQRKRASGVRPRGNHARKHGPGRRRRERAGSPWRRRSPGAAEPAGRHSRLAGCSGAIRGIGRVVARTRRNLATVSRAVIVIPGPAEERGWTGWFGATPGTW